MAADWGDDERDGLVGGRKDEQTSAAPRWFYVGVLILGAIGLALLASDSGTSDGSSTQPARGPVYSPPGGVYSAGIGGDMPAPPPPMRSDASSVAGANASGATGPPQSEPVLITPIADAGARQCVEATGKPAVLEPSLQSSSGPDSGWLMVVGGGGLPLSSAERFKQLAQQCRGGTGGPGASIVYIPTNDGQDYSTPESRDEAIARLEASTGWDGMVTLLHTTDPQEANQPSFYAAIDRAGGVWFGGGRQWRMADAYSGTGTEAALHRVLERNGILGGSSAGASIQGDFLVRGDSDSNERVIGDHTVGFGFVRNIGFDQHTLRRNRQNDMVEVVATYPEILGFSMDEQTSVLIRGNELEVLGPVARGPYSYVAVTDATLWSDTNYCGNYALTSGIGRPLLANSQKFFLLHTGDRYNMKTREVLPSITTLHAVCDIVPTTQTLPGSGLAEGKMYLTYTPGHGTDIEIEASGMSPGLHGVHIHESGDMSDTVEGTSMGGHYNPHEAQHGCAPSPRKVGDLGNMIVDEDGNGYYAERGNTQLKLDGPYSVIGRGLVVHALEDNCAPVEGAAGDLSAGARVGFCQIVSEGSQGTATVDGYTTTTFDGGDNQVRDADRSWIRKQFAAASCTGSHLCEPHSPDMTETAPLQFDIEFETTRGTFIVRVPRAWSPLGADRLFNLVQNGFFTDAHFYRVVAGFVAQFGSSGTPEIDARLSQPDAIIPEDPYNPEASNVRGTLAFGAEYDEHSMAVNRSTELYINLEDNVRLDSNGFTPVAFVVSGMDNVVANIYDGYGEMQDICSLHGAQPCNGPVGADLYEHGNEYLDAEFPRLDRILQARIVDLPVDLPSEVTAQNVMGHLRTLYHIANSNVVPALGHGNRDIGGPGFNASRDYVLDQLREHTDFDISIQYFPFLLARVVGTPVLQVEGSESYGYRSEFREMSNGGFSGEVTAHGMSVGFGCTAADYASFMPGSISIVQRGGCSFLEIGRAAQHYGASACIIANNEAGVLNGRLGEPEEGALVTIPVVGTTTELGEELIALVDGESALLHVSVTTERRTVTVSNIIAETKEGNRDSVVVVGSHLDGVAAGAGINDNGSGTSTNLEIALSLARLMLRGAITLKNQVRFCWWGAEEEGLVGSHWYVDHLSEEEISRIALNLNYDMVGSPNYIIGVYDGKSLLPGGDAESLRTGGMGQAYGSDGLQKMYEGYLESIGSAHVPVEFNGRSDYGPFLARGIPCGGLETGAEVGKTMEDRTLFGGTASSDPHHAAYDPCYHQNCDTIDNVDLHALEINAPTAAYAVQFLGEHSNLRGFLCSGGSLHAVCDIVPTTQTLPGSGLAEGKMYLTYTPGHGTDIEIEASGMSPGLHGVHIHESGDMSDTVEGTSMGGHYNPHEAQHGCAPSPRKVGDLGNMIVDEDGNGYYAERGNTQLKLDGPYSVIGRGLVVHALEDNCAPVEGAAGDLSAGARVGFCQIVSAEDEACRTIEATTLDTEVTVEGVMKHLRTLQHIADVNGGNRDITGPGFTVTHEYILQQLRENTDYEVEYQPFPYRSERILDTPVLEMIVPTATSFHYGYGPGGDFRPMSYSVGGDVTAPLWGPPYGAAAAHPAHHGCSAADWSDFPSGAVAMLERGDTESMLAVGEDCTFAEAAANAQGAGAAALLLFDANDPQHDTIPRSLRTMGPQALDLGVSIPVFAISFDAVAMIRDALDHADSIFGSIMVHLAVTKNVREITAGNIIATSRSGDPTKKIVIGAHMDGVAAGPGINDNGSGTSTNLEMALSLARLMARGAIILESQVRFCWWGAEEEGLVGSRWYVDHLPEVEASTIALNLNYDMVGSPNYIIGVYDGTQISGDLDYPITQQIGSLALMEMYEGYLESIGSAHVPVEFNGRSDYGPFLERGIPCGGLETGAEKIKTEDERQMFGGWANAAYDTCYHQSCDTIENVSPEALAINAPTASHAVEYLATHPDLQAFLGYAFATVALTVSGTSTAQSIGTVVIRTVRVDTVEISYECHGLAPNSVHGFHIHETADFSNGCLSTGGHYNPFGLVHGGPDDPAAGVFPHQPGTGSNARMVGDLGNILADRFGVAAGVITDSPTRLFGRSTVVGRSIVLHADADDLGRGGYADSLTTGHAGARVGCGEIVGQS